MKIKRAIIVYKRMGPRAPRGMVKHVRQHMASLDHLQSDLENLGISYRVIERHMLKRGLKGELMISVGGDGTFLACAHVAGSMPILGLNSMPDYSVGFFCAATAKTVTDVISKILKGRMRARNLPLIESKIGNKKIPVLALNDILFAGTSPAEMARYTLKIGNISERHRTSGLWISSGPGSTAAILSAGGKHQNIESKRLQYFIREPFKVQGSSYRLLGNMLKLGESIEITSEMKDAAIYIDGPRLEYPIAEGKTLTAKVSKGTLKVFL